MLLVYLASVTSQIRANTLTLLWICGEVLPQKCMLAEVEDFFFIENSLILTRLILTLRREVHEPKYNEMSYISYRVDLLPSQFCFSEQISTFCLFLFSFPNSCSPAVK